MQRLIVSDLDGTLLNQHHQLSARNRDTIRRLHQQGHHFAIATGRHHCDVQHIATQIGFPMYLITANGARVHNPQGEIIHRADLAPSLFHELLTFSADFPVLRNAYCEDEWLVEQENPLALAYTEESGFGYRLCALASHPGNHISKLFFVAEAEQLLSLEQALKQQFGNLISVTASMSNCLEVMSPEVSKGAALQFLLEQQQLGAQDCIAFGDGMNDVELLQVVGTGVVMANASERLKQRLPHLPQTTSNHQDGVANYLEATFNL